jgi:hypothetical protein
MADISALFVMSERLLLNAESDCRVAHNHELVAG